MKKSINLILAVILLTVSLTACSNGTSSVSTEDDFDKNSCYSECERFGGGEENVKMCKENCDASNDKDSVWNEDQDKYNEDTTSTEWPSDMPKVVPEFTYGDIVSSEAGMGSWIVDLKM